MRSVCVVLVIALSALPISLFASDPTSMTTTELLTLIEAGKAPVIVDVRSGVEYRAGHIPGALHVPFWSAYWRADRIPVSGHDPVVVYCAHGPRAGVARWALNMAGIPNVLYLKGHMTGWHKQALPEVKGEQPD